MKSGLKFEIHNMYYICNYSYVYSIRVVVLVPNMCQFKLLVCLQYSSNVRYNETWPMAIDTNAYSVCGLFQWQSVNV